MNDYRALLARVDGWYRSVKERHPQQVPCEKGCRECCLGLFDISLADRELLREGLAAADPATRRDIRERAEATLRKLRAAFPSLGDTLEGHTDDEIDSICDHLGSVECPVLGPGGECRLYEHRPLTCRLAGVPVVDTSGRTICVQGCSRCTLSADAAPRIDYDSVRQGELDVLRRIAPRGPEVTLLIPQAVL